MNETLLALVVGLGAVTPAWAGPRFIAGDPHDEQIATAAWQAGIACTGREGDATPVVEIVTRTIPGDYLGVADTGDDGVLRRIELNAPAARRYEVLAHEVAHAWVNRGPTALVEGAAELLADCMVAHHPGLAPLQYDDGRDLVALGDLRTWEPPDEVGPAALDGVRTDAYLGAARMMRTAALIVDPAELWATSELEWERFDGLLEAAGDRGAPLLRAMRGGVEAQRVALADADLDGLTTLGEALVGTDVAAFDSNGDGWWDGALAAPKGAVALPMDGTPVCTGLAAPPQGTVVRGLTGGNLRGHAAPMAALLTATAAHSMSSRDTVEVPGGAAILARLDGPPSGTSGGAWAVVQGDELVTAEGCVSTTRVTVWAHDPALAEHVHDLVPRVDRAIRAAEHRFGPSLGRTAVAIGGSSSSTFEHGVAWFSTTEVKRAAARGELDQLAYLAVSLQHQWSSGEPDWSGAEALARSLASR